MAKLLTALEVTAERGIPVKRLYALARAGLVPCVRQGRQVRFDPEAIEGWVRNGGAALPGGWRRTPADGSKRAKVAGEPSAPVC